MQEPTRTFVRLVVPRNPFWSVPRVLGFFRELRQYAKLSGSAPRYKDLWPQLGDKTDSTPIGYYFYQDTWVFHKIAKNPPTQHVDIASTALLVGCIAALTPTISVDIRPLKTSLPGLEYQKGTVLDLPFATDSVESISSLCVIEHIGLGRYGDPLDPDGSAKAAAELSRVLKPGGALYVSVPIGATNKVIFNAHRIFSWSAALEMFQTLKLVDSLLVGNNGTLSNLEAAADDDFPVGLFHYTK